jgi:hypothetical protein
MRKPVISSEISPKFDGFKTCDFLPVHDISQINMYQIQNENIKARLFYGLIPEI